MSEEEIEEKLEAVRECFDELVGMMETGQREEARKVANEGFKAATEIAESNSQDMPPKGSA